MHLYRTLGLLGIILLLIGGCVPARTPQFLPTPTAPSTGPQPQLILESDQIQPGTTLAVEGSEWPASTLILLALEDDAGRSGILAATTTTREGTLSAAFRYPVSDRWQGDATTIVAYSSGDEFLATATVGTIAAAAPETGTEIAAVLGTVAPLGTATITPVPTVTPTSTPEATPTPDVDTGWQAFYWNNPSLTGEPAVVRQEEAINANWDFAAPVSGITADNFSAQWNRTLFLPGGLYRFTLRMDDGARFFFDGQLLIDEWERGAVRTASVEVDIPAGVHTMRVDYFELTERAIIAFDWQLLAAAPAESAPDSESDPAEGEAVVPTAQPGQSTPAPTPNDPQAETAAETGSGWQAAYYDNRNLAGTPVLVRQDQAIRFDWGAGSPGPQVPADNFSVRWTQSVFLQGGQYQFNALSDDGLRVFIDGEPLINDWQDGGAFPQSVTVDLPSATYLLTVEYYEGTGQALVGFDWSLIAQNNRSGQPVVTRQPGSTPSSQSPGPTRTPAWTPTWTPTPQPGAPLKPVV